MKMTENGNPVDPLDYLNYEDFIEIISLYKTTKKRDVNLYTAINDKIAARSPGARRSCGRVLSRKNKNMP